MKSSSVALLTVAVAIGMPASTTAQIIRDDIFQKDGFQPFWNLGSQPAFDCVGRFKTAGGGSGVWLGDRYVLYVAHGSGGWKKARAELTNPRDFEFVLVKNGKEYTFRGQRWRTPDGSHMGNTFRQSNIGNYEAHAYDAFDFCVLELESAPKITGLAPARLANPSTRLLGEPTAWVGFGQRGIASAGSDPTRFGHGGTDRPIRKMAWMNRIDAIQNWGYKITATFDKDDLQLEGHQAGGSSGGGVFAKDGEHWVLVGLACNGGNNAGNIDWIATRGSMYGARSRAGAISAFYDQLRKGLDEGSWGDFERLSWDSFKDVPFSPGNRK